MKTVTTLSGLTAYFSEVQVVEMIAKAGFGGFDYPMGALRDPDSVLSKSDYLNHIKKIKQVGDDNGLPCLQTHSVCYPLFTEKDAKKIVEQHKRAIEIAAYLKSPYIVVHPDGHFTLEQNQEYIYEKLLPFAKSAGVKIATENMYEVDKKNDVLFPTACGTPERFCKQIDIAKDDNLVACLDIGHAELPYTTGAVEFIKALTNKRLKCLHIHDNDKLHDNHTVPYQTHCSIPWDNVINALKEIKYDGNITFECNKAYYRCPPELILPSLKYLSEIGNYFVKKLTE